MAILRKTVIALWFVITLPAHSAVEITIEGLDTELTTSLLTALSIERQKDNDKLTAASIKALYKRSTAEVESVMHSHGYYHYQLEQSLQARAADWLVNFSIVSGAATHIAEASIIIAGEGKDDTDLLEAAEAFPLQPGMRLEHDAYEAGKKHIQNLARQKGYFDAVWGQHRLEIDTSEKTADIKLRFDTGPRYRYDTIVLPDSVILPELLQKLLTIESGQYYDLDKIVETQQLLQNSNYFSQVEVEPGIPDEQSKLVAIAIRLGEKKKNAYRVGLGFGTDTGPRLVGAWDSHYLNRRGHRLENDLRLSLVQSSLSTSYLIPFFLGSENELGITAAVSREDTDTSISNKFQSSVQHLSSRWGWNETASLTYQFEDFEVADTNSSSHLLIPGVSYWKSVSDNPIYAQRGFRLSADLRGSIDGFISDVSFLQLIFRGKYIYPLTDQSRLIVRGETGATLTSSFTRLPSSFRFFAGGDNSIRGFDLEVLGPRNASGEVTGGKYLAVGSVEYEHRVYEKWSVAVFSDFGNAFDSFSSDFEYSIGTGIRWQSPVGLIRVDVASGISDSDYPIRLHIIVGPDL